MSPFTDLLRANEEHVAQFTGGDLTAPAAKHLAIVTCMDSRIEPLQALGLQRGDAKVIRNAGGRVTDDALRSLVVAVHLLAVQRILVLEHTDCGMTKASEERTHELIRERSGIDTRTLELGTISDQQAALRVDVQRLRSCPYLPEVVAVAGGMYDVRTGRVEILVD
jgi:carbonic anhydrase